MTDKETFRTAYNLLQRMRQAGRDANEWGRIADETNRLYEEHSNEEFLLDLIRAVYSEICRCDLETYKNNISYRGETA